MCESPKLIGMLMKTPILPLLFLAATATLLPAAKPDSLEMKDTGEIAVLTDSLGGIQIGLRVTKITEEGAHLSVDPRQKTPPTSGAEVAAEVPYTLPDGSQIVVSEKAAIEQSKVTLKGSWPNETQAKGYVVFVLKIPGELADNLTVEADGKPIFANFDKASFLNKLKDLVFRKTSTGEFLFKLEGETDIVGGLRFDEEKHDNGIVIDVHVNPSPGANANLSEATETAWTLSFKE